MHKSLFFPIRSFTFLSLLIVSSVQAGDVFLNLLPRLAVDPCYRSDYYRDGTNERRVLTLHGYIRREITLFETQARILASRGPNYFDAAAFEHAVRSLIELTKQGAYEDIPAAALKKNKLGCALITAALWANNLRAVFILMGENVLNPPEQNALQYAIRYLLNLVDDPNHPLRDPLDIIVDFYDWDSIKKAVIFCDLTVADGDLQTLLFWAARYGSPSIIEQAIEQGADVDGVDHRERTALHTAVSRGHLNAIVELVEDAAQDLPTRHGNCALHIASNRGHIDLVKSILNWYTLLEWDGIEGIDKPGAAGQTALHIALRKNNLELVELLINSGANLEARDDSQVTPLDLMKEMEWEIDSVSVAVSLDQSTSSSSSWQ